jgi:hypothetical protein
MNDKRLTTALNQLAAEAVPPEADLWPALRAQLAQRPAPAAAHQGQTTMTPNFNAPARLRWVGLTSFIILALAAAFALLPQGRALAQSLWLYFNPAAAENFTVDPALGAAKPSTGPTAAAPSFAADVCGADLTCQFNTAAEATGLSVRQLPNDFSLYYVQAFPDSGTVVLGYTAPTGGMLVLSQSRGELPSAPWTEVPADKAVAVQVNGAPAEYVEGTFVVYPDSTEAVWDPHGPMQRLRWEVNGVLYELTKGGDPADLEYLDQAAMIALAEQIK